MIQSFILNLEFCQFEFFPDFLTIEKFCKKIRYLTNLLSDDKNCRDVEFLHVDM